MQRDTTAMRLAKISRMKKLLLIALSCATPISCLLYTTDAADE